MSVSRPGRAKRRVAGCRPPWDPASCFAVKLFGPFVSICTYTGEHQQQHRQADRDGLDRPQPRDVGGEYRPHLPGDHDTDDGQREHELDQGAGVQQAIQQRQVVPDHQQGSDAAARSMAPVTTLWQPGAGQLLIPLPCHWSLRPRCDPGPPGRGRGARSVARAPIRLRNDVLGPLAPGDGPVLLHGAAGGRTRFHEPTPAARS